MFAAIYYRPTYVNRTTNTGEIRMALQNTRRGIESMAHQLNTYGSCTANAQVMIVGLTYADFE